MERITFALAQYTPDLLRQEPKNIGVFVADELRVLARFLGEDASGSIILKNTKLIGVFVADELRVLARFLGEDASGSIILKNIPPHFFNDVDLYLDWHDYWSNLLNDYSTEAIASAFLHAHVIRNKGKAFSVVYGGEYETRDERSLEEIASRLFERLVLSQSARLYNSAPRVRDEGGYLGRRLAHEFRRLGILERADSSENLFVRYPVRTRVPVSGTNPIPHIPDFYQENGKRYVMEQVDFSVQTLARARDRAMYSHYLLTDIAAAARMEGEGEPPLSPIAVVNRVTSKESTIQDYALAALSDVPGIEIVYWDRDEERRRFLHERRTVAEVKAE